MRTLRTLLRFAACGAAVAAISTSAHAQGIFGSIAKKATDAVSQKAQDKVNSKIDEMSQKLVDNSFNTIFGDSASPAAKGGAGGAGSSPFSMNSNVKTESSYSFNVVTTMEIESSKNPNKAVLMMHFNTNEPYTGTKIVSTDPKNGQGTAFVILDAKNSAMVMLMATDKSKFSTAFGWSEAMKYAPAASTAPAPKEQVNWDTVKVWKSYSKIGSKTIAGYQADGYRMDSQQGNVEIWVSRDTRLNVGNMFAASADLKQMKGRLPADYPQGVLLQMVSTNSSSGERVTMTVTSIDTDAHVSYSMADYPKMGAAKQ